jgi:hypothetical protein
LSKQTNEGLVLNFDQVNFLSFALRSITLFVFKTKWLKILPFLSDSFLTTLKPPPMRQVISISALISNSFCQKLFLRFKMLGP